MSELITCSNCYRTFKIPGGAKTVKCNGCGAILEVKRIYRVKTLQTCE